MDLLRISCTCSSASGGGSAVWHRQTVWRPPDNSWLETQITWANRPARTTTPTDDKGAITAGTWVQYDVKPLMAADGTYSFVLATGSPDAVNFASRDSGDLSQRPELALVFGNP